ncbi:hypothetical protein AGMMS50268_24940 [Spirochaetia bacterium]|nr:hypothetical protein AGMMS50268_24940 [Spirochaetia bacterium]
MQGQINADLTSMPPTTILIITVSVMALLVVTTLLIFFLVKKLNLRSLGPLKVEHQNQSTMYDMNEKNYELDDLCRKQMRQITNNMKIHISNIFAELEICTIARLAISSSIRFPLYESVANNHFTTELMPDSYDAYRERILEQMRDEYVSISSVSRDIQCNRDALPVWEEVHARLIDCIDLWLKRISREVMLNCEKKIAIYKKYLRNFEQVKDDWRTGIVRECIEKNEKYMTVLKTRISKE